MPGHFLVKYDDGRQRVFVDPFNGGRMLKRSQCQKWLRETLGRRVILREHDFASVDKTYIIRRMLNNLRDIYLNSRRYRKGLEVIEMLLVLSPVPSTRSSSAPGCTTSWASTSRPATSWRTISMRGPTPRMWTT